MGKSSSSTPEGKTLAELSKALFTESDPTRRALLGQTTEALRTGGIAAQIPMIQRMVEGTKAQSASALAGTDESLRSAGLKGTPYGQQILAKTREQGAFATGQAESEFTRWLTQLGVSGAVAGGGQGLAGLGDVAKSSAGIEAANQAASGAEIGGGAAAGGAIIAAVIA